MKFPLLILLAFTVQANAQNCATSADLETTPGKYLTAAENPWPAVRAGYFQNLTTVADKATAKKTLDELEKTELQSRNNFSIEGGHWENSFSSEGYATWNNIKLGKYSLESSFHEFFCLNGKLKRNDEYSTVLRFFVNSIPTQKLDKYLSQPFNNSMGEYDYGLQYADYKNHKSVNVNDPLITLFTFFSCNSSQLIDAINSGKTYFQDVPEKDIKPKNRSIFITRYWFATKQNVPALIPVSRKQYLESLLEYYEREKIYFPKLLTELTTNKSSSLKKYQNWQIDVEDKIAVVKNALATNNAKWLSEPAIVNRSLNSSQTYKAKLFENTNYNRFWGFTTDGSVRDEILYQYNPAYFKPAAGGAAKPQLITVAFRYISMPSSLRLLNNFTTNFDFKALDKMVE